MSISREVLAKYIRPGCTFIETGTRWGDTCIKAIELGADRVYSFEIDKEMADIARRHVADALRQKAERVSICPMNSEIGLSQLMGRMEPCDMVAFLDAHSESYSPVGYELEMLHKCPPRCILIDDLRCMDMWGVSKDGIANALKCYGYAVSYEDGVEPMDIMVGTR